MLLSLSFLAAGAMCSTTGTSPDPAALASPRSPLTSHIVGSSNRGLDEGLLLMGATDRVLAGLRTMRFTGTERMPLATTWPCAITGTLLASLLLSCGTVCTPPPPTLETSLSDCTQQSWCTSSTADQCTTSSTCTKGPQCTSTAGCTSAGKCTERQGCTGTPSCTQSAACTQGNDCTAGQYCTDDSADTCTGGSTCTEGTGCTGGANCTAGAGCTKDPQCTKGPKCTTGTQCSKGATCTKGATCPKKVAIVPKDGDAPAGEDTVGMLDMPGLANPDEDPHFAAEAPRSASLGLLSLLLVPAIAAASRRRRD